MSVDIRIDFEVTDDLIKLVQQASTCPYLNLFSHTDGVSFDKARLFVEKIASTKKFAKYKRMGFLKIYAQGVLVGFSLPRQICVTEYESLRLPIVRDYYRVGSIFIAQEHRGHQYAAKATMGFKQTYKRLIWACDSTNISSQKTALNAGLKLSHTLYFNQAKAWSFDPPPLNDLMGSREIYCS